MKSQVKRSNEQPQRKYTVLVKRSPRSFLASFRKCGTEAYYYRHLLCMHNEKTFYKENIQIWFFVLVRRSYDYIMHEMFHDILIYSVMYVDQTSVLLCYAID